MRLVLIVVGLVSVGLGAAGIVLPLLPTTPFLLLAALCFSRGSQRFHRWLLSHRLLGPYIRGYVEKRGIPLRAKILAIAFLWVTIFSTALLVVDAWMVRGVLLGIAAGVTVHIATRKTAPVVGR